MTVVPSPTLVFGGGEAGGFFFLGRYKCMHSKAVIIQPLVETLFSRSFFFFLGLKQKKHIKRDYNSRSHKLKIRQQTHDLTPHFVFRIHN